MREWFKPGSAFAEDDALVEQPRGWFFLAVPILVVVAMWMGYWLDERTAWVGYEWGIMPQSWEGLRGIVLSPLLHGSFKHLANNSMPILVLGAALFYFYPRIAGWVGGMTWLISGALTWVIARGESYHIGASGVVYGLAAFIFFSGLLQRRARLLALSLLVAFLYGGLVWGLLPVDEKISYEAHLAGGIAGLVLAVWYRKVVPAVPRQEPRAPVQPEEGQVDPVLEQQIARFGDRYWMGDEAPQQQPRVEYHYREKEKRGPSSDSASGAQ